MTEDELELAILKRCVAKYEDAERLGQGDKCVRELNLRDLLDELTELSETELMRETRLWLTRLAKRNSDGSVLGPLRRCSNSSKNEGVRFGQHQSDWQAARRERGAASIVVPRHPARHVIRLADVKGIVGATKDVDEPHQTTMPSSRPGKE